MRIAVFGNVFQQKKSASVRNLLALLQKEGDEILIDEAFHSYLQNELRLDVPPCQIIRGEAFRADVAVSMGGDGTFLEAARRVGDKEIPILGVNMGRLGYLSDFSPEEMEQALAQLRRGDEAVPGIEIKDKRKRAIPWDCAFCWYRRSDSNQ